MYELTHGGQVSTAEAAAIAAAIRRFRDDHAPVAGDARPQQSAWLRAALLEGAGHAPDAPSPWGEPAPWSS